MIHFQSCFILLLLFSFLGLKGQNLILKGYVKDHETGETLPFASIHVQDGQQGTVSNQDGFFYLNLRNIEVSDTLVIAYLGYRLYKKAVTELTGAIDFLLNPYSNELAEIVVNPLTPEQRLLKALLKSDSLLIKTTFRCQGYFIQEISQNYKPLIMREAILNMYQDRSSDSVPKLQIEVVEGHQIDNINELLAFKKQVQKRHHKQIKKLKQEARKDTANYERKMDSIDDTRVSDIINIGAPDIFFDFNLIQLLKSVDIPNELETLTQRFKKKRVKVKHKYEVMGYTYYQNRPATILQVKEISKKPYYFKFYISEQDEIMRVDFENKDITAPFLVKAGLAILGYGVTNVNVCFKVYYRPIQNKWYIAYIDYNIKSDLIDRHFFKANDTINYIIHSQFIIEKIYTQNVQPIPDHKRLKNDQPFSKQLGEYHPEFWKTYRKRK